MDRTLTLPWTTVPAPAEAPYPEEVLRDQQDIPFLTKAELAELIRAREVSPVEAASAYLGRIDSLNFKFNSYLTVSRKEAMAAAREAERAIAGGEYLGPMHGIPVALKDQIWTKGIRTTVGSRLMADFFPEEDATAVAKLKRAGAVVLGKTNLTEFALAASQRYGLNRNPWDLDRFTGGPAAPVRPPPPSCAPRPWVRTPAAPSAARLLGAASSVCGPVGAGSAASVSLPGPGPWTRWVPSPGRWKTPP